MCVCVCVKWVCCSEGSNFIFHGVSVNNDPYIAEVKKCHLEILGETKKVINSILTLFNPASYLFKGRASTGNKHAHLLWK